MEIRLLSPDTMSAPLTAAGVRVFVLSWSTRSPFQLHSDLGYKSTHFLASPAIVRDPSQRASWSFTQRSWAKLKFKRDYPWQGRNDITYKFEDWKEGVPILYFSSTTYTMLILRYIFCQIDYAFINVRYHYISNFDLAKFAYNFI